MADNWTYKRSLCEVFGEDQRQGSPSTGLSGPHMGSRADRRGLCKGAVPPDGHQPHAVLTVLPRAGTHCHTLPIRSAPDGPHHRGLSESRKVAGNDWSDNSFGRVRGADERHIDGCVLGIRNHPVASSGGAGPVSLCAALSSPSPGEFVSDLSLGSGMWQSQQVRRGERGGYGTADPSGFSI